MSLLSKLKKVSEPVGGVRPSFEVYHVYAALVSLYLEAPIGRLALAKRLSLGEASVKTLVRRMKLGGLVDVDRAAGVLLTEEGREVVEYLKQVVDLLGPVDVGSLCGSCEAYGAVLRKFRELSEKIGYLKLRDQVVREGAEGAIIIYCGETPVMPVSGGLEKAEGVLRDIAVRSCSEDDVLVLSICYRNGGTCAKALVNAVLKILDP
ncbi:MAG: DUF4443 domain-containing protein [Sulfolobales archaeon]|nr:winged helix-turn-helix domain-containing protein [Sulfolobales archaeon]MCX8208322.1 winged helix-turn-helix domain-containing protein [Sulfolobales archaeon]MDW8010244.1 DUF4443 domain-containing protein [Sulfolobales archaeon]